MKRLVILLLIMSLVLGLSGFILAEPNGAIISPGTSTGAGSNSPGSDSNAIAGNITELTVLSNSSTQSWQGYFGNVTGTIGLADSSSNVLYNWSLASPEGEIYSTNASSVSWVGIQCYDEPNNMTYFENMFGILTADADGLNETFNLNNHAGFYTNSIQFTSGQCNSTKLYNGAGVGTFDEVLLTDGANLVFASLLLDDTVGFDSNPHDFEMIVLENGHGSDTSTTTYYFWTELG